MNIYEYHIYDLTRETSMYAFAWNIKTKKTGLQVQTEVQFQLFFEVLEAAMIVGWDRIWLSNLSIKFLDSARSSEVLEAAMIVGWALLWKAENSGNGSSNNNLVPRQV